MLSLLCKVHAYYSLVICVCVVDMHRAGQAASQSCVALVVGSIPHRVAYRSGLVQNSDLVQYAFDLLSVLSTILIIFCVVLIFCVVQTALQFCGSQIVA